MHQALICLKSTCHHNYFGTYTNSTLYAFSLHITLIIVLNMNKISQFINLHYKKMPNLDEKTSIIITFRLLIWTKTLLYLFTAYQLIWYKYIFKGMYAQYFILICQNTYIIIFWHRAVHRAPASWYKNHLCPDSNPTSLFLLLLQFGENYQLCFFVVKLLQFRSDVNTINLG